LRSQMTGNLARGRACSSAGDISQNKRRRIDDSDSDAALSLPDDDSDDFQFKNYDSKGWFEGNGISISKVRAASFAGKITQCGSCPACSTERCGICCLCRFGPSDACVLKCCDRNSEPTKAKFLREIKSMLNGRKDRGLEAGTRVIARSHDNVSGMWFGVCHSCVDRCTHFWLRNIFFQQWRWGTIRTKYKHCGGIHNLYTVDFDDGTARQSVPEKVSISLVSFLAFQRKHT